jgi:hypothetical protein
LAERISSSSNFEAQVGRELRPIQFAIHKEKEMVDFRRLAIAMALLAVVAGLAGAQTVNQSLTCQTNVAVTPTLRSEGFTEQTGDITLVCTGGAPIAPGTQIPQINITLFYNSAVTSRLIPQSPVNNISEALLLLDDPGSGVPSQYGTGVPFGVGASQILCTTPTTGCVEFAQTIAVGPGSSTGIIPGTLVNVASSSSTAPTSGLPGTGPNVFQGLVTGNQIQFFGIPFLAPVTTGISRSIRITNARVNATSLGGGSAAGATPVVASISITGATSLPISNATPTVGFVQGGLSASASGSSNRNQCSSDTIVSVNTLSFAENFPTAFKTRVAAQNNSLYAGQTLPGNATGATAGTPNQNIPGAILNSESNFVFNVTNGTAGLADFGTRLRAVFNNVPTGVRIFVSTVNVFNNGIPVPAPSPIGGSTGNTAGTNGYAQLVTSETVSDGNAGAGFFPAVTATTNGPNNGNVPVAEVQIANGSGSATWEVVNTNPNANETLRFAVYESFSSNVAQNSPPPGTATVNLSFAPAPPTFSASSGAAASSTLSIPRFIADPNAARNIFNINICRTILLYPYVTNIQGFDTGLAIANTTTDPFGTGAQSGSCDLNWYQGTNNPAKGTSGTIASGTIYTTLASTAVPGFNGYMIAVCNFQFAHGFAFVSDVGARNLAMGYLAVVIADPGTGSRVANPLGASLTSSGEQGGH